MRRVLIFAVAVLMGVATLLLMQAIQRAPSVDEQIQPQTETSFVLVYARDLARGTLLDASSLRWQEQLASALSPRSIVASEAAARIPRELEGKLLRSNVLAGEMVRIELLADGAAGFMALTLTPGMRAVGLSVTEQKLAGGYILPEDRVDLIHTFSGDLDGDGVSNSFSQTILENIRVLAVGETPTGRVTFQTAEEQEATVDTRSDVRVKGDTITLEMSDEQAHTLFAAQASGQVSLALRALEDQGPSRIVSRIGLEGLPPVTALAADNDANELTESEQMVFEPPPDEDEMGTVSVRVIQGNQTSIIDVPVSPGSQSGALP